MAANSNNGFVIFGGNIYIKPVTSRMGKHVCDE